MISLLPSLQEIKRRRKLLGITQPLLAKEAGVSQSLIAKLEAGKVEPSYSRAAAIFSALDKLEANDEKRVKDVMVPKITVLDAKEPVQKAVQVMKRMGISQVPVVRKDAVVGSITEKGILDRLVDGQSMDWLSRQPLEAVMEDPFPIVSEDIPVKLVLPLIQHHQAIIVARKGQPVGIITKADLLGLKG